MAMGQKAIQKEKNETTVVADINLPL